MKFCRKEKQDCCQTEAGGKKGLCLLKGMAVALAMSCIFFIAYGIVLTYTSLAESTIPIVALCCTALSAGIAGFDWAKCIKRRGLIWGLLAGLVYGLLLWVITSFGSGDFALHTTFWRMMAVALAGGAAGGLMGIHKIS